MSTPTATPTTLRARLASFMYQNTLTEQCDECGASITEREVDDAAELMHGFHFDCDYPEYACFGCANLLVEFHAVGYEDGDDREHERGI